VARPVFESLLLRQNPKAEMLWDFSFLTS